MDEKFLNFIKNKYGEYFYMITENEVFRLYRVIDNGILNIFSCDAFSRSGNYSKYLISRLKLFGFKIEELKQVPYYSHNKMVHGLKVDFSLHNQETNPENIDKLIEYLDNGITNHKKKRLKN